MTAQDAVTPQRRWPWLLLLAVVVPAFGVGAYLIRPRPDPLKNDPAGKMACSSLADWLKGKVKDPGTGQPEAAAVMALAVSTWAAGSSTASIRATVGDDFMATDSGQILKAAGGPASLRFADLKALHQACVTIGVHMPAYSPPST